MEITEFLEERIKDDVARINWAPTYGDAFDVNMLPIRDDVRARLLAECAAKRAILAFDQDIQTWGRRQGFSSARHVIHILAAVYKDHSDYKQEWAL